MFSHSKQLYIRYIWGNIKDLKIVFKPFFQKGYYDHMERVPPCVSVPGSFPCWFYDNEQITEIARSLFSYTPIYLGQNAGEKKITVLFVQS